MLTPYTPYSKRFPVHSMMSSSFSDGVERLHQRLDSIYGNSECAENHLIQRMGFSSLTEACHAISAEQADSLLLIDERIRKGGSFLVADKTGIGKGRILAGAMKIAIQDGLKVIFLTEKTGLLNDIWRDIEDVSCHLLLPTPPLVISSKKQAIYNAMGEVVTYGGSKNVLTPDIDTPLVLSTYSQYTGKVSATRVEQLKNFLNHHRCLLILDESHNLNGELIALLSQLKSLAHTCVLSSATYMSSLKQMYILSDELNIDDLDYYENTEAKFAPSVPANVYGNLLIGKGSMLRREHAITMNQEAVNVSNETNQKISTALNTFQSIIASLEEQFNILIGKLSLHLDPTHFWVQCGGHIDRLVKTLIQSCTTEDVAKQVMMLSRKNIKSVVVTQFTNMSAISHLSEHGIDDYSIAGAIQFLTIKMRMALADKIGITVDELGHDIQFILPDDMGILHEIPLSLVDHLNESLKKLGINNMLEVSGREYLLQQNQRISYKQLPVSQTIKLFNNGNNNEQYDCIVLTSAGSTGFSLHASPVFKDQRQRALIEWGIPNSVMEREQFLGRINRVGTLHSPLWFTIAPNHSYAQRLYHYENAKLKQLREIAGVKFNTIELGNVFSDTFVRNWMKKNHEQVKHTGISAERLSFQVSEYVDTVLRRSWMLSDQLSEQLLSNLFAISQSYKKTMQSLHQVQNNHFMSLQGIKTLIKKYRSASFREGFLDFHPNLYFQQLTKIAKKQSPYYETKGMVMHNPIANIHPDVSLNQFEEKHQPTIKQNMKLIRSLTTGMVISFKINNAVIYGKVVGFHGNSFSNAGVHIQAMSQSYCIGNIDNDILYFGFPVLLQNSELQVHKNATSYPKSNSVLVLAGHPILISYLGKIINYTIGSASLSTGLVAVEGFKYPVMLLPSNFDMKNFATILSSIITTDDDLKQAIFQYGWKTAGNECALYKEHNKLSHFVLKVSHSFSKSSQLFVPRVVNRLKLNGRLHQDETHSYFEITNYKDVFWISFLLKKQIDEPMLKMLPTEHLSFDLNHPTASPIL